jgi:DMSO/TMAO reductase YedYZ molybdopterin-dependent catalytic subunit
VIASTAQRIFGAIAIVVALSATAGAGGCSTGGQGSAGVPESRDLGSVEVRDYRGEKLGAIADFRENSIKGPQKIDRATYRLRIDGAVALPADYRYENVITRETTYTKVVQLDCVEGWSVKALWEGVLISDLVDRARPETDAVTVVFHAADGYSTSLPLGYVRSRKLLLAYKLNGVELPPARGFPFQVVAQDKWGYKWCKWVTRIELSADPAYRGYWESRGYSSAGDLDKPSIGP